MPRYHLDAGSIQHKFSLCRKKIQGFGGGFGNGKTAAACVKALQLAMDYPGSNGLIARETYVKLNDTIRREFYKWIPSNWVARWPTTTDNTMVLTNGSTINFRYIAQRGKKSADGSTTSNLLSATYDWIVVDQIEDPQIMYKDFLDLLGRLRGATPYKGRDPTMPLTGPRWLIFTANPAANWVYTKLVKPYHAYKATGRVTDELIHDEDTLEPLLEIFEGSTYGNARNLEADFIQGLEASYKGQMRKRYLMGEWAAYEGLVYPEFSQDMHMVPHNDLMGILNDSLHLRTRYEGVESFDFGISQPSCYLRSFTDDIGRVFVIDGFYEPGLTTAQIAQRIIEIQNLYQFGIEQTDPIWADPAIFKRTQVKGQQVTTIANLLTEEGLYVAPAQNDIKNGIMKVTGYLNVLPDFHYKEPNRPGPAIYFSDKLQFIADEFLSYFWKTNTLGERVDEPTDRNDHAMDGVKYLLSKVPDPSELVYRKPYIPPEYMTWREVS